MFISYIKHLLFLEMYEIILFNVQLIIVTGNFRLPNGCLLTWKRKIALKNLWVKSNNSVHILRSFILANHSCCLQKQMKIELQVKMPYSHDWDITYCNKFAVSQQKLWCIFLTIMTPLSKMDCQVIRDWSNNHKQA